MGVIGNSGGGYATVNPTQGNPMGQAMANIENSAFRYSEQRAAKDKAKADAEMDLYNRRRQEFNDAQEFGKQNPFVKTGTGLDGSNMQSYNNAKDSAAESMNQYYKTGDKKFLAAYQNAVASAKAISEMPNQLNVLQKTWNEDPELFNQQSLKNKMSIIDKMNNGNIVQTNDENGRSKWTIFDRDDNGDITRVVKKDMNASQLKQLLEVVPNFNIDGTSGVKGDSFVKTFNENIGKPRKTTVIENGKEIETEFNPGSEELAKIMATEAVQDRNKLYNVFTKIGIDAENEENYQSPEKITKAQKYLEDKLIASAPKTVSERPNYEAQKIAISRDSKNETARHNRAMEARERNKNREDISLGNDPTVLKKVSVDGVRLSDDTYSYPLSGMMIGKDGKGITATNIFVSPSGKMRLRIEEVGYEGDSSTKKVLTQEAKEKLAKNKSYKPKDYEYESVTVTDRKPKGRLLDFGSNGTEISKYAKKAGITVRELQNTYIDLYEKQSGKKLPRPMSATSNKESVSTKSSNKSTEPAKSTFDAASFYKNYKKK